MKTQFEKINEDKFKSIPLQNLHQITGGANTKAGQIPTGVQYKKVTDLDGRTTTYVRTVYMTYGSDDIDGKGGECYYDTGTATGRWTVAG